MANNHHNLLVLFYTGISDEKAELVEMAHLTALIKSIDFADCFCVANELLNRNSITSDKKKIMKEAKYRRLRPFKFFINKN